MTWWDQMPWSLFFECWALCQLFHSALSTFIKRLFSSSSLSAIRVVSSAYLRLLIFLPAVLIPACGSSCLACHMMYSAYMSPLNKQGENIQPWCTPLPIWNQSIDPCPVLTVASWPAHKFLRKQVSSVQFSHSVVSNSLRPHEKLHTQRIFQFVVIHTVKGFGVVHKAETDVFLELSFWLNGQCCCSVPQSCPTLCNPTEYSPPGSSILQCLLEFAQILSIESVTLSLYCRSSLWWQREAIPASGENLQG